MPPVTDRLGRRDLPAPAGMRWLAGDLHAHTVHSDGVLTVPELARFAVERGLDFLAVTDHNTISHHAELPAAAAGARHRLAAGAGGDHRARATPTRSATSAGWTSASRPTSGWPRRSGLAGCCPLITRTAVR